jgi:hypothetical protein
VCVGHLQFARYQADQLPAIYRKQPELYEAQIQTPLGREWNTQHIFNSVTRPRVRLPPPILLHPSLAACGSPWSSCLIAGGVQIETKKGHIIRPISRPSSKGKSSKNEEDQGEPVNRPAGGGGAVGNKRKRVANKTASK